MLSAHTEQIRFIF